MAQEGLERSSMLRVSEAKCSGEVSDQIVTSISGRRLPTLSSLGAKNDNRACLILFLWECIFTWSRAALDKLPQGSTGKLMLSFWWWWWWWWWCRRRWLFVLRGKREWCSADYCMGSSFWFWPTNNQTANFWTIFVQRILLLLKKFSFFCFNN